MWKARLRLTIILTLVAGTAAAQLQAPGASGLSPPSALRFRTVDDASGLDRRVVTTVVQGPEGFIWVGTPDGLFRYDGLSFRRFHTGDAGLTGDNVSVLETDCTGI